MHCGPKGVLSWLCLAVSSTALAEVRARNVDGFRAFTPELTRAGHDWNDRASVGREGTTEIFKLLGAC